MPVEIEQFMCRSDNFGVLVHDPKSGQTAIIDAPEEAPILAAIKRTGWTPTMILTTHHHMDHVEANLALKERFKLRIVGPEAAQDLVAHHGAAPQQIRGSDLHGRRDGQIGRAHV